MASVMQRLPPELVARLPLGDSDRVSLACSSRALRDAVVAAACVHGIITRETDLHHLRHDRYKHLVSLTVVASPHVPRPSPAPVPRDMPALRRLSVCGCRSMDPTFWLDVVHRAPGLRVVKVSAHAVPCANLLDAAHLLPELERLEVRAAGAGPPCVKTVRCPRLHHLVVAGGQVRLAVDAPLLTATLDEPCGGGVLAAAGPSVRKHLESLTWSVPAHSFQSLCAFASLAHVHVEVRHLLCPVSVTEALRTLESLPPRVERLAVALDLSRLQHHEPRLSFDAPVLRHLDRLREVHVTLSYPALGSGALIAGLLGAPADVERASVTALTSPTSHLRRALADMLDDGADPDGEDVTELHEAIDAVEHTCAVSPTCLETASTAFPRTELRVHGFRFAREG